MSDSTLLVPTKTELIADLVVKNIDPSSFLGEIKEKGLNQFLKYGLPSIKNEEWKYTSTKAFEALEAEDFLSKSTSSVEPSDQILIVDGNVVLPNELNQNLPKGIVVKTFGSLTEAEKEITLKYLSQQSNQETNGLVGLNTASFADGLFIYASKGAILDGTLRIVHKNSGIGNLTQTRVLIALEDNAEVKLTHHFVGGEIAHKAIFVSEAFVGDNAHLKVEIVQEAANTNLYCAWFCQQGNRSVTKHSTATLSGPWVRNNLHLAIDGQFAEGNMYGLYLGKDKNLIDNHTLVDHIAPNSNSNELYKGVAKDRSTAIFNGKIFVKQAAQKTNAFQSNRNLMLSDDANIYTKPQLEIFADDVKCSHGATTGALDEEPLFYLRTRGLSKDQARSLLLQAFAEDIVNYFEDAEFKALISAQIESFLG